jgi:hypothetical protein
MRIRRAPDAEGQNILGGVKPLASKVDQRILSVLRPDQRGGFIESWARSCAP